ncbi:MAG TPA: SRPBCC family protein [Geodermatophilus sp.]|nr:SRPBCC family protein [Geodermatophilus sp.]
MTGVRGREESVRTTTASGSREVPAARATVWQALAVLAPYCSVCDVSYVVDGAGAIAKGTRFVCVPGKLDGAPPAAGAPEGEIVEWVPRRRVTTRLELTPETWTTRIELADAADGGTRVTITVSHEPTGGSRLVQRLQRGSMKRLVQRTVDSELAKLPDHIAQVGAA